MVEVVGVVVRFSAGTKTVLLHAVTNVVGVFGTTNIGRSGSRAWVDLVFFFFFF